MTSVVNLYNAVYQNMQYNILIDASINNNQDYSICSNMSIMYTRIKNRYPYFNTTFAINDYSASIYNNNILYTYMSKLKIVQVACGFSHTLLLENTGRVLACGDNTYGQLGIINNIANLSIPTYVLNITSNLLQNIIQVECGAYFSIFLENTGRALTCGQNTNGQLANNGRYQYIGQYFADYALINNNSILENIIQIAAGSEHSLFLESIGTVWACGRNNYGQLGANNYITSNLPGYVFKDTFNNKLDNITQIAAGTYHSLFLENSGNVLSCGYNAYGQLGVNTKISSNLPAYVLKNTLNTKLDNIIKVSAGGGHSLFLENTGMVLSCGWNASGQLGVNTFVSSNLPVYVLKDSLNNKLDNIIQIRGSINTGNSFFLENTGKVLACGNNSYGQLGINQSGNGGTGADKNLPVYVLKDTQNNQLINIIQISCGSYYSWFIDNTGKSLSCGNNTNGQLAINVTSVTSSNLPVYININYHNSFQGQNYAYYYNNPFSNINIVLETTPYNNSIIEYGSNLVCYGHNYLDMYGNTKLLVDVLKIETGAMHSIFLRNDYKVYSCGNNFFGQLGTNNNTKYYQPQAMSGTNNNIIIDISSGAYHNLLLTSNNSVFSCGRNNYGQLGLNDNTNRTSLTKISISDIINIKCGENHSVFLNYSGNVYSCGLNLYGQLSTSNTTNYSLPTQVVSINRTEPIISNIVIRDIACGKNHTIMLGIDKMVYVSGNNNNNQLGISYSDLPFSTYPQICFTNFFNYDLKIYSNAFIDKTYILLLV